MIIIAISDLHGSTGRLKSISSDLVSADVVLVTGDITHFGGEEDAARIINEIRNFNETVLAVHGNCDFPEVDTWLAAEGISLHGKTRIIDNIAFAGTGASLPCPGRTPNELEEKDFKILLETSVKGLPEDMPLLLVTHQPPRAAVVDRVGNGMNVGSHSVRQFIKEKNPLVCFSGHIHEAKGSERIEETVVANPGPLSRGGFTYARINSGLEQLEIRG